MGGSGPAFQGWNDVCAVRPSKLARLTGAQQGTLASFPSPSTVLTPAEETHGNLVAQLVTRLPRQPPTGGSAGTRIVKTGLFVVCRMRRCFRTLPHVPAGARQQTEKPQQGCLPPSDLVLPGGKVKS
jgi:hypothetical protein